MLIAEQLLLLLLEPERGVLVVHRPDTDPDRLAAAALLLDLAEQGALAFPGGQIALRSRFPSGHPIVASVAAVLDAAGPGLPLASALDLVETRIAPVARALLDSLCRRDHLHRVRPPIWRPWAQATYPLRSSQARNEAIRLLRLDGAQRTTRLRSEGLVLLVDCAGRLAEFLDAKSHARATETLLALGHRDPHGGADAAFLGALRAALLED